MYISVYVNTAVRPVRSIFPVCLLQDYKQHTQSTHSSMYLQLHIGYIVCTLECEKKSSKVHVSAVNRHRMFLQHPHPHLVSDDMLISLRNTATVI